MFGLTFEKLAIIAVIAVFVIGPEKLPLYAGRLAALVKSLRGLAESATARVRDELGPELTDTEWKKLDPRQYDPRRIIRAALVDTGAIDPGATPALVRVTPPAGNSTTIGATTAVPATSNAPASPPAAPGAAPKAQHSMQRLIGLTVGAQARTPPTLDKTETGTLGRTPLTAADRVPADVVATAAHITSQPVVSEPTLQR